PWPFFQNRSVVAVEISCTNDALVAVSANRHLDSFPTRRSSDLQLTTHAVRRGCAGALMLPPFYYKDVSEEGLYRYFSEVVQGVGDRKSTRLNSSHLGISYAVFCLKNKTRLADNGC